MTGKTISHYRILEKLGGGGMRNGHRMCLSRGRVGSLNGYSMKLTCLILMVLSLHRGAGNVHARETPKPGVKLKFIVILSRHGVRSPTWDTEELNQYSAEPWPQWDVPPGYLTPHGKTLMKLFGAYDRAFLAQAGLLSPSGCGNADQVYFWADNDARTLETGRALAAGMLPDCAVETHSLPQGTDDAVFSPIAAGVGRANRNLAAAAVLGRIGGNPGALLEAYRPALEKMQQVLLGCKPGAPCPPDGKAVRHSLLDVATSVGPGEGDHLAEFSGPLHTASTLAEDFLLEYANGMADNEVGWGRINESNLRQMMSLHLVYADLLRRTPYLARVQASNLLSHILKTMEQAVLGRRIPGGLGKPGTLVVVIVGHDTNLDNVAGTLGLSWLIEGFQRDDTAPGGALVFELWRQPVSGEHTVRTYYMSQTLEQMRKGLPLTLNSPPAKAPIFLPGCSTATEGLACGWKAFQHTIETAIDRAYVQPQNGPRTSD